MSEFIMDDGRKAEKVETNPDALTKVTEVFVEPKASKRLSQRVIERFCVCERETQIVNEETGEVVDRVIENLCSSRESKAETKTHESHPMREAVEKKIASGSKTGLYLMAGVIAAQVLALAYVVFFM